VVEIELVVLVELELVVLLIDVELVVGGGVTTELVDLLAPIMPTATPAITTITTTATTATMIREFIAGLRSYFVM